MESVFIIKRIAQEFVLLESEILKILLVPHGSQHNDTIVTLEVKDEYFKPDTYN